MSAPQQKQNVSVDFTLGASDRCEAWCQGVIEGNPTPGMKTQVE